MLQGMTAHYLAVDTFPLQPGQRCLVHAGAGGVGLLLIQIAKRRGAEVLATVGAARARRSWREAAGADHVIVYADTEFGAAVDAHRRAEARSTSCTTVSGRPPSTVASTCSTGAG